MKSLIIILGVIILLFILLFVTRKKRKELVDRIKSVVAYYKLWLTDTLADLTGTQPGKIKNIFDIIYWFIKMWGLLWPIIGAAWLVWDLDNIKAHTSTFFSDIQTSNFKNHSIDWSTTVFNVLSIVWLLLFLFMIATEDKISNNKFNKIKSAIIRAPNMVSFKIARMLLEDTYDLLDKFKPTQANLKAGDYSDANIDELVSVLLAIALNTRTQSRTFFNNNAIVGVNIMGFFENDQSASTLFPQLYQKSNKIYFRCEEEANLSGILFLPKELMDNALPGIGNTPSVIIPIYHNYLEAYKNPNEETDEFILPGATLAYRNGTSMIGDTRDIKKYFSSYDAKTQKELKTFFCNSGKGKDIRSLASFRIPGQTSKSSAIGILNLDSNISYAFGENEEFFETFYTMIYPILLLLSEQLEIYKNYRKLHP